jgi:DNA-binding transcriptional activator of the SARP family
MESTALQVRMLGEFSIRQGRQEINDSDNRSRKVWLLLAYMIYCRNRNVSQEELIDLLWGSEERSSNPINALKTIFHRVRSMLDQLGDNAGHTLIVRRNGSYAWNPSVDFSFDVEEFESLCKSGEAAVDEEEKLSLCQKALELYAGDFLPKLSSEPWVIPVSTYFHNLYVRTVLSCVTMLETRRRLDEAVVLCRRAVEVEPYEEDLYRHLLRNLLDMDNQREAITVYQNMSDLMFSNFGIMPSDDIKALYREAVRSVNDRAVSLNLLQEQLQEPETGRGAMMCDYDFFKVIYHAQARAVARSGDAVHIGLLTVTGADGELSRRSLDCCMDNLQELVCSNLRKGDIASRCSVSQYILMLQQANYENSCMVMDRIVKAFCRQYPHSPAVLRYSVQPLEPNV